MAAGPDAAAADSRGSDSVARLPRPESLASAQARSGLSDVELARIFKVPVAALASWNRHGVPRADAHRLRLLSEVLDALESCAEPDQLTQVLRRPLPQPGTPSLVDLLARRDTGGITAYLVALNPGVTLTGRALAP